MSCLRGIEFALIQNCIVATGENGLFEFTLSITCLRRAGGVISYLSCIIFSLEGSSRDSIYEICFWFLLVFWERKKGSLSFVHLAYALTLWMFFTFSHALSCYINPWHYWYLQFVLCLPLRISEQYIHVFTWLLVNFSINIKNMLDFTLLYMIHSYLALLPTELLSNICFGWFIKFNACFN